MRISFRDVDDGQRFAIYGEGRYLGEVKLDIWSQKWTIHPVKKYLNSFQEALATKKYESSYKAGKILYHILVGKFKKEGSNPFFPTDLYKHED
tara:strand:- start:7701 stop:7979 length:279 start_codon:yes stop_codon:yes gene_type:complete